MTERKVCLVGVNDVPGSTNISMVNALLKLNCTVIPVNYRTILATMGKKALRDYMEYVQRKYQPDFTLFSKCNGMETQIVDMCSQFSKTWLFNMDPIQTIERCPEVVEHAKNAHFSSCTGIDIVEWFKSLGVKNCYHIIQGTDYEVFRPVPAVDKYVTEISFIGGKTEERDHFKSFLEKEGFKVKFYGLGYTGFQVIDGDFAKVCASSTFMLSMNTVNDVHKDYFSNRLVRYLSCGVCTLHYDNTGTLNKYFEDGKEILYFNDENHLTYLMDHITLEEAGKIALRGREKVLGFLTWEHVMSKILEIAKV